MSKALPQGYEEEADEYASIGYILWYDEKNPHYRVTDMGGEEISTFIDLNEAKEWRLNH